MKLLRAVLGVAACALLLAGTAQAQNKIVIKLGWATSDAPTDTFAIGARLFKAALEEEAKGQFDVQLYPNRQIGDEKQLVEGLRLGTVDAAIVTNPVYAQFEPSFLLNDLPFLYPTEERAFKILDGDIGKQLAAKIEKKGIVMLAYMSGGYRQMLNNKKPVSTPEDVKGVKYRTMQNPVAIEMYTALGGSPTPLAWSETLTALQQGAVDGMDLGAPLIESLKVYEAVKYLSLTNHSFSACNLAMSKRLFDKLSPAQRTAVRNAAAKAAVEQRKQALELDDKAVAALRAKGMVVNKVADIAPFRARVMPVYDKFRADIGSELLDATLAQVK